MNTATMDGSRALYGIARDGMTLKQLGRLNRHHVPGVAMSVDAVLNIALLFLFDSTLGILAAGNLGYVLSHIVALSGFLLLRKDRGCVEVGIEPAHQGEAVGPRDMDPLARDQP